MGARGRIWSAASVALLYLVGLRGIPAAGQLKHDFCFSILGDRTGDADQQVYEQVWKDVDSLHPAFVINVGDTIQGGNDATADSEWRALRLLWRRYSYPLYFTPGNHDIWSAASRTVFEKETGRPAAYGFNYKNAHFTVLDNSETENLSGQQMEFLARDLAENRDRDPKFVFFHKPFWLIPVTFQSGDFPFHQLIRKYGVRYVISGHGHQFVRLVQDGIVYLEAPSSGGQLKGQGFMQGWFFGQVFTCVKASQVDMLVKEVQGPMGTGHSFRADEWLSNSAKKPFAIPAPKVQ
jgi:hypothetical protein